jgi:hypothetical protein
MQDSIHVFGIRHHGPGSARSLIAALTALEPDCILVEGPPDAQEVLPLALHAEMAPPVALLVYARDDLHRAAFFPFAAFSPEWQAIRFGLERDVPVRLMDLPQAHALAVGPVSSRTVELETRPTEEDAAPEKRGVGEETAAVRVDPLQLVAEAAGFEDGERWWEQLVEQRRDSEGVFEAILEIIGALRAELAEQERPETLLREAYMRRILRQRYAEGYRRIAVVCGAWHAPALLPEQMPPVKEDNVLLKGLPKVPVVATWVPWTHSRLAAASGYGAGIASPGWYGHLWEHRDEPVATWLARVAHLLREKDLTASPAQIIDAVRLAETLAALRGRPTPALAELNEAAVAVLCHGDSTPLALIQRELIVGDTMGSVPGEALQVALQRDLQQTQKRLRMKPAAGESTLKLDLRKPLHLERSQLLYRLQLLEIPWGQQQGVRQRGTFNEVWKLRWEPELNVRLIEKSVWGNSVVLAATAYSRQRAAEAKDLPALSTLTQLVLLADLPEAAAPVLARLQELSALTGDVALLMQSLPPLADVLLYGNVRQSDATLAGEIVDSLVVRICVGLPPATLHLDDSAAGELFPLLLSFHAVVQLLDNAEHTARWHELLQRLVGQEAVHPLLRGRACRILLDAGLLAAADAARRLRLAITTAVEPAHAAAWLEGFLRGSGAVLLHHERLLHALDGWLLSLSEQAFRALLPLVRRTFHTFNAPERAQIGRMLARGFGAPGAASADASDGELDPERAALVLPTLALLLGVNREVG